MKQRRVIRTPLGMLRLEADGRGLTAMEFCRARQAGGADSPLLLEAEKQLVEYFAGARRAFRLPSAPEGTPFQQAVWKALLRIPCGETRSYGEVARMVGRPSAARAVGQACNRNPLGIVVPCHRVVGKDGALTGYAGGIHLKRRLLALERQGAVRSKE
ncbi:MAG: methylated-DNA--[protein]-cysteine S-methyltransferase [Nitrospirae bacterium]|nr:methylated-DNA--[protein]-cysteine S-methyltransferase [Nitrospirota bacterium]